MDLQTYEIIYSTLQIKCESVEEWESTILFWESLISMCFNILVTYFINSVYDEKFSNILHI